LFVIDPTLVSEMAMHKGVELLGEFADDASTGEFQLQIKVRIAEEELSRERKVYLPILSGPAGRAGATGVEGLEQTS
jgi:hypothetical protein